MNPGETLMIWWRLYDGKLLLCSPRRGQAVTTRLPSSDHVMAGIGSVGRSNSFFFFKWKKPFSRAAAAAAVFLQLQDKDKRLEKDSRREWKGKWKGADGAIEDGYGGRWQSARVKGVKESMKETENDVRLGEQKGQNVKRVNEEAVKMRRRRRRRRKGCLPAGKASSSCITRAISSFSRCCHGERCWGEEEGGFWAPDASRWERLWGILSCDDPQLPSSDDARRRERKKKGDFKILWWYF